MNDRFIHPFIHRINTYSACYILGTILGGGNISEQNRKTKQKQKKKNLPSQSLILVWETDNQEINMQLHSLSLLDIQKYNRKGILHMKIRKTES